MEQRKMLTCRLTEQEAEKLAQVAKQNNLSVSEQVRRYVNKGITVDAYQTDEEKILANMKGALREVLDPQIDRIVKITVKNAIASSVNLLYTAMMLYRVCTKEVRPKLEVFMEDARRMGIRFVQLKEGSIDEYLKTSMARLNEVWENHK